MQIRLESVKKIGRKIGLNDEKGYAVAVFLALIIVSALSCGLLCIFQARSPQGTAQFTCLIHKTKPLITHHVLVANQNSTFNVPVAVENHMGGTVQYQVLVKITK